LRSASASSAAGVCAAGIASRSRSRSRACTMCTANRSGCAGYLAQIQREMDRTTEIAETSAGVRQAR
jgi:hypothetical protein